MREELFENPRLAAIYDHLEGERDDLVHYEAIVRELAARSVLDVGCGTGTLACSLAAQGLDVTGVDPAKASLDAASLKPGAELVRWVVGDATRIPALDVDLAVMTANVAQVFVTDGEWSNTLLALREAITTSGHLVFETRDPADRAWERWNPDQSFRTLRVDGIGEVATWHETTHVALPLVSFVTTFRFEEDGAVLESESTLRFRGEREIRESLSDVGFRVAEVRDAPDRPGRELVFIAHSR